MTVYTWDGRVLHHNDCTFCVHRKTFPKMKRAATSSQSSPDRCGLTQINIPAPLTGTRFCENYQQIGCECLQCQAQLE